EVDLKISNGETALIFAAANAKRDAVTLLLDNKASIEAKGTTRNALVAAACAGQSDVARTLVDRGADVNALPSPQSQTALSCAAQRADVDLIRFLLDKGADINATARDYSPLQWALDNRDTDKEVASALLLINRGADVNATPQNRSTPLDRA